MKETLEAQEFCGEGNIGGMGGNSVEEATIDTTYKVAGSNLPATPSVWTKIKNALFYEIKVELTPKQQQIEDEINEFLHQEITWGKVKSFLFQEIKF